jgi:hypothetical protein
MAPVVAPTVCAAAASGRRRTVANTVNAYLIRPSHFAEPISQILVYPQITQITQILVFRVLGFRAWGAPAAPAPHLLEVVMDLMRV